MKEMEYIGFKKNYREILEQGNFYGFDYYIINLGTHPCSYVKVPKNHVFFKKGYYDIDIDCHGGLTYASNYLSGVDTGVPEENWYIGWDYAHFGDYVYFRKNMQIDGHKWTIEELRKEAKEVCKQLAKIN